MELNWLQGMAQGCISGITSFALIIAPLVFSPLTGKLENFPRIWFLFYVWKSNIKTYSKLTTVMFSLLPALFLSEKAPFHFPGFSLLCTGFAWVRVLLLQNNATNWHSVWDNGDMIQVVVFLSWSMIGLNFYHIGNVKVLYNHIRLIFLSFVVRLIYDP